MKNTSNGRLYYELLDSEKILYLCSILEIHLIFQPQQIWFDCVSIAILSGGSMLRQG